MDVRVYILPPHWATKVSIIPPQRSMNLMNGSTQPKPLTLGQRESIPPHERVLDRLADLLFDADDLLEMLRAEDAMRIQWVEPRIQRVYDEVNEVMKRLCD
jgi:hypothetical protein